MAIASTEEDVMAGGEMDRRNEFMRTAIKLSLESVVGGGGPFGAVVVRDGVIVGRGQNHVTRLKDPTAHAEIMAIRDACAKLETFQLDGCELFTSCEPCPMCLGAILWARLDRVWYGNSREDAAAIGFDDRSFYDEVAKPTEDRRIPMRRVLEREAHAAFDAWQAAPEKSPY